MQKRVTLSFPNDLDSDLNYIIHRMKISKSSLVSNVLRASVADMRKMLEDLPDKPTPDDIVRSRGASKQIVEKRLQELRAITGEDYISD